MIHNLIHLEQPVQKAGQTGAALPPLPRNFGVRRLAAAFGNLPREHQPICGSLAPGGAGRVAGGAAMGNQTGTAALASFRHGLLPTSVAPRATAVFFRFVWELKSSAPGTLIHAITADRYDFH